MNFHFVILGSHILFWVFFVIVVILPSPPPRGAQYLQIPLRPAQAVVILKDLATGLSGVTFHYMEGRGSDRDNEASTAYIVFTQFYRY